MTFTVRGVLIAKRHLGMVGVTWTDRKLTGNPEAADVVRQEALFMVGERIGPEGGPYTRNNHLAEPTSASIIMASVFLPWTLEISGDVPERPALPPGAVG